MTSGVQALVRVQSSVMYKLDQNPTWDLCQTPIHKQLPPWLAKPKRAGTQSQMGQKFQQHRANSIFWLDSMPSILPSIHFYTIYTTTNSLKHLSKGERSPWLAMRPMYIGVAHLFPSKGMFLQSCHGAVTSYKASRPFLRILTKLTREEWTFVCVLPVGHIGRVWPKSIANRISSR